MFCLVTRPSMVLVGWQGKKISIAKTNGQRALVSTKSILVVWPRPKTRSRRIIKRSIGSNSTPRLNDPRYSTKTSKRDITIILRLSSTSTAAIPQPTINFTTSKTIQRLERIEFAKSKPKDTTDELIFFLVASVWPHTCSYYSSPEQPRH